MDILNQNFGTSYTKAEEDHLPQQITHMFQRRSLTYTRVDYNCLPEPKRKLDRKRKKCLIKKEDKPFMKENPIFFQRRSYTKGEEKNFPKKK